MSRLITIIFFLSLSTLSYGQIWQVASEKNIARKGLRGIQPASFQLATVDDTALRAILWSAPAEAEVRPNASEVRVPLMLRTGEIALFKVVEYKMMQEGLAAKYPDIKTFKAVLESDPRVTAQIDYTVHGLRAVINDRRQKTYIDHYQRDDKATKVIYTRDEYVAKDPWQCLHSDEHKGAEDGKDNGLRQGDCQLREYELSVTATGEYSNYHGATSASQSALVQSAVVTTINRVNEVYEIDLAVRFVLIDNNDDIYYYDPATDPFSGNSVALLAQNQTNTDAIIGNANYDIGHIVSTGTGGVATLSCLCDDGIKARGFTGLTMPEGDPFDIDYVSHEIGHQMGGNHTQNNACNRNDDTAIEPGSASTIMGYAGICSPNVQNNSDPYFHAISIQEMANQVILENNTDPGCQDIVTWSNTAPSITPIADKTIPQGTPFVLDAVATDGNGDVLTYNWEQMDTEVATMPPASTNTGGPTFRSLEATLDSKRYLPSIDNIVNGTSDTWEVLPTVNRNLDFRLTVRDSHMGMGGCTSEIDVALTVDGNSGPFVVNTANTDNIAYEEGESVEITWNVANTNTAPVSCSSVDILMSLDGGLTYPDTLATGVSNDGSYTVIIPVGTTVQGRFMVKCSDSYFFDINDRDFVVGDLKCVTYLSEDLPVAISSTGLDTVYSGLTIQDRGDILDMDVVGLVGTHSWMDDLSFALISPDDSEQVFWANPCQGQDDFDINLDDEAADSAYPCPPTDGLTYIPDNPLSFFDTKAISGDWQLKIIDRFDQDGGELEAWGLELCLDNYCDLTVDNATSSGTGSIVEALACAVDGDTVRIKESLPGTLINLMSAPLTITEDIVILAEKRVQLLFDLTSPAMTIVPGTTTTFIGFDIRNVDGTAINNHGNLTLRDINIIKENSPNDLTNGSMGTLQVEGNCNLSEE